MSVIGSNILAGASGQGGDYTIARSLRFRSSANANLSRTPSSAGNRRIFTWSGWIKRGTLGSVVSLIGVGTGTTDLDAIDFQDECLRYTRSTGGSFLTLKTTAVFRDPSAWYHVVVAIDTTQATASNRVRMWVNGSQITSFSSSSYPSQNEDTFFNSTNAHTIGRRNSFQSDYYDGYMTEINFIDGQALTPSSFGATNASTGVWQPKKYAGTYGTNGFYLPFTNNSTTTTLGNDFSGNGNNWTTNNISLTAGSTYDSMTDVPTLTSATAANFATANQLYIGGGGSVTYSNGNLTVNNSGDFRDIVSTIGATSGKFYAEVTPTAITTGSFLTFLIDSSGNYLAGYYSNGTRLGGSAYGASYAANDVIGVAFDIGNTSVTFYKNNVSQGSQTFTNFGNPIFIATQISSGTRNFNFGQQPFAYTPPTGFVALNTFNLPTPTIGATASTQAGKYFNTVLYTGNGTGGRAITGLGFSPDFVWIKSRSNAYDHELADSVRGATRTLQSNNTSGEFVSANYLQSFDSDGFTLGNWTGGNGSGATFASWAWRGSDSSAVTNTAGSITSTVSANTSAGFSVVTYTGTGANATVGHGLGVAPRMYIVKRRNAGGDNWAVYHASTGNTQFLRLDTTNAAQTFNLWQNTTPTSSVFYLTSDVGVNGSGSTYVAYCFSEVAGYSRFGSYTGNGSTDGPFIFTGFRPRFVMMKRTDVVGSWYMIDTSRAPTNVTNAYLIANGSNPEATDLSWDVLSNGFKLRSSYSEINTSGGTYIYMAFAENPFKYSLAR